MQNPAQRLRNEVEAWRRSEARAELGRWRGERGTASPIESRTWLLSDEAREVLGQAAAFGLLEIGEEGALRAHLREIDNREATRPLREWLYHRLAEPITVDGEPTSLGERIRALGSSEAGEGYILLAQAITSMAALTSLRLLEELSEAQSKSMQRSLAMIEHPDSGTEDIKLIELAQATLRVSEEASKEALASSLHSINWKTGAHWSQVFAVLHGGSLADVFPARDRWRRWGSWLNHLGVRDELLGKVRIEAPHSGPLPSTHVAAIDPPLDVRIASPGAPFGILAELSTAEGIGRALALALTSRALPSSFRFPVSGTCGRAFGGVLAQLLMDGRFLGRFHSLGKRQADSVARLTRTLGIFRLRTLSASVLTDVGMMDLSPTRRLERSIPLFCRALGAELPHSVVALSLASPFRIRDFYRGTLAALALYVALRNRFDEDWYSNPRTQEAIRAGCERGGSLSAEAWCHELGGSMSEALTRLSELGNA